VLNEMSYITNAQSQNDMTVRRIPPHEISSFRSNQDS